MVQSLERPQTPICLTSGGRNRQSHATPPFSPVPQQRLIRNGLQSANSGQHCHGNNTKKKKNASRANGVMADTLLVQHPPNGGACPPSQTTTTNPDTHSFWLRNSIQTYHQMLIANGGTNGVKDARCPVEVNSWPHNMNTYVSNVLPTKIPTPTHTRVGHGVGQGGAPHPGSPSSSNTAASAAAPSAAVSFFARAAQKLSITSRKKKKHVHHEPSSLFPTNFSEVIRLAPPPAPPCLLRAVGARQNLGTAKVKVMLRVCPVDTGRNSSFLSLDPIRKQVTVFDPASSGYMTPAHRRTPIAPPKMFGFDAVFSQDDSLAELCATSLVEIVQAVVGGSDGCLFCYGHARLGKTYTMLGVDDSCQNLGVIPSAVAWLFRLIAEQRDRTGARFSVRVSAVEVTGKQETLKDLLAHVDAGAEAGGGTSPGVYLREDPIFGMQLENQSELRAPTAEKAAYYLDAAIAARTVPEAEDDARNSHMLFTLHVYQYRLDKTTKTNNNNNGMAGGRSRLHLLDLGSCSKGKDGNALSLQALGNVIWALLNGQRHVPYRDSKLTQLMRESLGNLSCRTCMIAHVSPTLSAYNETLHVIQQAAKIQRMKRRRNKFSSTSSDDSSSCSGSDSGRFRRHPRMGGRIGIRMGTLREDAMLTSSFSDPDYTSSSEQSCDTVIYVGANGRALSDRELTDNEGPPILASMRRPSGSRSDGSRSSGDESGRRVPRAPKCGASALSARMRSRHASPSGGRMDYPYSNVTRSPMWPLGSTEEEPKQELWVDGPGAPDGGVGGGSGSRNQIEAQWVDGPGVTAGATYQMPVESRVEGLAKVNFRRQSEAQQWVDGPTTAAATYRTHAEPTHAVERRKVEPNLAECWIDGPNAQVARPAANASEQWIDGPKTMTSPSKKAKETWVDGPNEMMNRDACNIQPMHTAHGQLMYSSELPVSLETPSKNAHKTTCISKDSKNNLKSRTKGPYLSERAASLADQSVNSRLEENATSISRHSKGTAESPVKTCSKVSKVTPDKKLMSVTESVGTERLETASSQCVTTSQTSSVNSQVPENTEAPTMLVEESAALIEMLENLTENSPETSRGLEKITADKAATSFEKTLQLTNNQSTEEELPATLLSNSEKATDETEQLKIATDRPPVATDRPPVATDRPPVATDRPPVTTDRPPVATKRPPVAAKTKRPPIAAKEPSGKIQQASPEKPERPETFPEHLEKPDGELERPISGVESAGSLAVEPDSRPLSMQSGVGDTSADDATARPQPIVALSHSFVRDWLEKHSAVDQSEQDVRTCSANSSPRVRRRCVAPRKASLPLPCGDRTAAWVKAVRLVTPAAPVPESLSTVSSMLTISDTTLAPSMDAGERLASPVTCRSPPPSYDACIRNDCLQGAPPSIYELSVDERLEAANGSSMCRLTFTSEDEKNSATDLSTLVYSEANEIPPLSGVCPIRPSCLRRPDGASNPNLSTMDPMKPDSMERSVEGQCVENTPPIKQKPSVPPRTSSSSRTSESSSSLVTSPKQKSRNTSPLKSPLLTSSLPSSPLHTKWHSSPAKTPRDYNSSVKKSRRSKSPSPVKRDARYLGDSKKGSWLPPSPYSVVGPASPPPPPPRRSVSQSVSSGNGTGSDHSDSRMWSPKHDGRASACSGYDSMVRSSAHDSSCASDASPSTQARPNATKALRRKLSRLFGLRPRACQEGSEVHEGTYVSPGTTRKTHQ